jgi:hypothetical protein
VTGEIEGVIAAAVAAWFGSGARVVAARERAEGEQGFSGATLRYYDVTYSAGAREGRVALVTKDAPPTERRALDWLARQGLPVPFAQAPDLASDAPALVCMEYAGDPAPAGGGVQEVAEALAAIHHAALRRGNALPWLPRADPAFFAGRIIDTCWRGPWRHLMTGEGYTNWYGQIQAPIAPDPEFAEAFDSAEPALEEAAARFLRDMTTLWEAGDALTLLHADFHGGNVRWQGGSPRIIDWEHAVYGPLYIDLPNYFTREQALLYRDALATLGHAIPRDRFLAGYDAARPYPGFKYFGIGLWNWRHGDHARRHENVQHFIDMILGESSGTGR